MAAIVLSVLAASTDEATLEVSASGEVRFACPSACGAATTTNTDSISITGSAGADVMNGGFDNDVLDADDDAADVEIHGGPGNETAYFDAGTDPATIAVENPVPR